MSKPKFIGRKMERQRVTHVASDSLGHPSSHIRDRLFLLMETIPEQQKPSPQYFEELEKKEDTLFIFPPTPHTHTTRR